MRNTTIAFNKARKGAGLLTLGTAATYFGNTIISRNYGSDEVPFHERNVFAILPVNSEGYNLIDSIPFATNMSFNSTDIYSLELFSSLRRDYEYSAGSLIKFPTPVHNLLPESLSIDAGSSALAVDPSDNSPIVFDQRGAGFPRVVGGTVDIGAVEY